MGCKVRALSFCITRNELCYCVELNGTSEFQRYGTAWTWSENWAPAVGRIRVPAKVCCGHIDYCNFIVTTEVLNYIREGMFRHKLNRFEGIAVEAMGDSYELVWLNDNLRGVERESRH